MLFFADKILHAKAQRRKEKISLPLYRLTWPPAPSASAIRQPLAVASPLFCRLRSTWLESLRPKPRRAKSPPVPAEHLPIPHSSDCVEQSKTDIAAGARRVLT